MPQSWEWGKSLHESQRKYARKEGEDIEGCSRKAKHVSPAEMEEVAVIHIHGMKSIMGHYLLETKSGRYYHVNTQAGHVTMMNREQYRKYLTLRHEKERTIIHPRDPAAAAGRLNEKIESGWDFGIYNNNCRDFVEYVVGQKV